MCLLNLDTSQIFSVLCFLQSLSSSYIRFKCISGPFAPWQRTACPLPSVWMMVESAQRLWARSWRCQHDSDASCSPHLRLCWRFNWSCALCAQTGCCYETHQQFLRDSLFPVSERYDAAHVCEMLGMSRAVVESNSTFISTHTAYCWYYFVPGLHCMSKENIFEENVVYFLNLDDERFSVLKLSYIH